MNRSERAAAIEEAARTPRTGPRGLYTPDMVESMDADKVAAVLNSYVERLNIDQIAEAKRNARKLAIRIFVGGIVVGAAATYVAVMLWLNPLYTILRQLTDK
jgi:hypothetical protein